MNPPNQPEGEQSMKTKLILIIVLLSLTSCATKVRYYSADSGSGRKHTDKAGNEYYSNEP